MEGFSFQQGGDCAGSSSCAGAGNGLAASGVTASTSTGSTTLPGSSSSSGDLQQGGVSCSSSTTTATTNTGVGLQSAEAVVMIQQMMEAKQQEVREAALTALVCLGPLACETVPQVLEIARSDKYPSLRILAVKAMEEIGGRYLLPYADQLLDAFKKESDKGVKKQLQATLRVLQFTSSSSLQDDVDYSESKVAAIGKNRAKQTSVVSKSMVREALQFFSSSQSHRSCISPAGCVCLDDLIKYFEVNHPTLVREIGGPRIRLQVRIILKKMVSKNSASRTPAFYKLL